MSFWKYPPNDPNSKSLDAITNGTGKAMPYSNYEKVQWLIVGNGAVSAGAVIIESANDLNYSGTWNQVVAPVTVTANAEQGSTIDAPPGGFLRARVTTTIVGGTVTVYLNAIRDET
jgi:hypothetical protein